MEKEVVVIEIGVNSLDFLTIKALKVLEKAKFVVIKDEIDPGILELVKSHFKVFCPKEDSTELIINSSETSIAVLTTRSSFELPEIVKLRSEDVKVVAIPSVKPYLAYSALEKVPITKRGVNLGFAVVKERIKENVLNQYIDLAIATNASIVFCNNFFLFKEIVWRLKFSGKGEMPVAVVNLDGGQGEWTVGTAETIEELILLKSNCESSFIVVGEVVREYRPGSAKEFEEIFVNKI